MCPLVSSFLWIGIEIVATQANKMWGDLASNFVIKPETQSKSASNLEAMVLSRFTFSSTTQHAAFVSYASFL